MPLNITPNPVHPECEGARWVVNNIDQLAYLTALVLIGRDTQAAKILQGAGVGKPLTTVVLKKKIKAKLILATGKKTWHRDGLLFEIICWIAAQKQATVYDLITTPHLRSTDQGVDTMKITFNPKSRTLTQVTVYEYKCTDDTEHSRTHFKGKILPAFELYINGEKDDFLSQTILAALARFNLTIDEVTKIYDTILIDRPISFFAGLTVNPTKFELQDCKKLFKDYDGLSVPISQRIGDTLPLEDIRPWFELFAQKVWTQVEAIPNV